MKERIANILRLVSAESVAFVREFEAESDNAFIIKNLHSDRGHRIRLWFEASEISVRTELSHVIGYLDISHGVTANDLLRPLLMNSSSLNNSYTYLAAEQSEGKIHLSLRVSQVFLLKWSDEDIAQVFYDRFVDINAAFMFGMPEPIKVL